MSRGAVATVRTGVLVIGAFLLAGAGRREAWREASWLVYPIVVVTGLKILVEDLPGGRPATLFITFGLYGAALLLVPRIRQGRVTKKAKGAASGEERPASTGT